MDTLKAKMSSLTPQGKKHKVTVVGSGNWGSTIAKVVAENTAAHPELFEKDVQMWVYEEDTTVPKTSRHYDASSDLSAKPQKLTHLINHFHENVKYLPGILLPKNVIANPSVTDAVKNSTILIFNLPHQFIGGLCKSLRGHIVPYARGISCIKGVNVQEDSISLFSETIGKELGIYCGALSGANIANEVAQEKFSETTIAYDPPLMDSQNPTPATSRGPSPESSQLDLTQLEHKDVSGKPSKVKLKPVPQEYPPLDQSIFKTLFHRRYFQVRVVSDVAGVSLGGALKNIIAVAAGFVDGLGWGDNAKAAVMRIGLLEMVNFGQKFFGKTVKPRTFTEESAGVADLITTCAGGRNHRCAKLSIERGVSIEEVEAKELNGQKLQGTLTAGEVNKFLKSQSMEKAFPLFTAVSEILQGRAKVEDLPELIEKPGDTEPYNVHCKESPATPSTAALSAISDPIPPSAACSSGSLPQVTVDPDQSMRLSAAKSANATPSYSTSTSAKIRPEQSSSFLIPPHPLSTSRYHRQLLIPSISIPGQEAIAKTKVLAIGLGGLGSPACLYLAAAGIGTLGLVDADNVELSNLHRQIAHTEARVGMSKVESALRMLREHNSDVGVRYVGYQTAFRAGNAVDIVEGRGVTGCSDAGEVVVNRGYDIVLDCTDNPATRYLISDVCVATGRVLVSAAAQRGEGQLMRLCYPTHPTHPPSPPVESREEATRTVTAGPCYRCVFPTPPPSETVQSCSEIGILGPVVGVMGTLMAMEVLKIVTTSPASAAGGQAGEESWRPTLLLYNAISPDPKATFRSVGLRKAARRECLACGNEDVLSREDGEENVKRKITRERIRSGEVDYLGWCGDKGDLVARPQGKGERVNAEEFVERMTRRGAVGGGYGGSGGGDETHKRSSPMVVDVREKVEYDLGTKVKGSINIPISRILRPRYGQAHGDDGGRGGDSELEHLLPPSPAANLQCEGEEEEDDTAIYFICQRGNDSQVAARKLLEAVDSRRSRRRDSSRWIGDVVGGFEALQRYVYPE